MNLAMWTDWAITAVVPATLSVKFNTSMREHGRSKSAQTQDGHRSFAMTIILKSCIGSAITRSTTWNEATTSPRASNRTATVALSPIQLRSKKVYRIAATAAAAVAGGWTARKDV